MQVRPATPDDAVAIERVARAGWHAAYDDILGAALVDERVDEWYDIDALRAVPARVDHALFVADEGDVVGFAHAGPAPEGDGYVLYRLYVLPDHWRRGIGTALLAAVADTIREATDRLRLTVYADNEVGVRFYEARGFERVGSTEDEHGNEEVHYETRLRR
jgi:ribosomal protein S18 acetylase RimI-like enzyme